MNATTLESPGRILATAPRPAPFWRSSAGDEVVRGSLLADRVSADRVIVRHLPDLTPVVEIPTPPVLPTDSVSNDLIVRTISFDRANNLMVEVGSDVTIWDPIHGRQVGHVDLAAAGLAVPHGFLAVRPGKDPSQLLVVAENQPDVHIVDVATSRQIGRLPVGPDVLAAGLDLSGRYVDLLRRGGVLEVWDADRETRVLGPLSTVPPGPVADPVTAGLAVGFTDDSGDLFVGAGDRIRFYSVGSPAPTRTLNVGEGQQIDDASADGQVVITRPSQGSGRTLSLRPTEWEHDICRVIGNRTFTEVERNSAPASLPDDPICPRS